ncbi:MAG TPA: aldolase, partial [Arthrobacter bacterium]|nr:aldolase [Arthrobacter sp.]
MVNNMTDGTDMTPEGLLAGIQEARLVGIVRGTDG